MKHEKNGNRYCYRGCVVCAVQGGVGDTVKQLAVCSYEPTIHFPVWRAKPSQGSTIAFSLRSVSIVRSGRLAVTVALFFFLLSVSKYVSPRFFQFVRFIPLWFEGERRK